METYLVTEWTDSVTGAKGYLSIDKVVGGVAGGGIRMRKGVTKEEVQRLSHTMTLKLAGLDVPLGGAKAGIDYSPAASDSYEVLSRFLEAHKPLLLHTWGASEDMGTTKEEITNIVQSLGLNTGVDAFLNSIENKEVIQKNISTALNLTVDGMPITDVVTGLGVAAAAKKAIEWIDVNIENAKVAIQGFGSVGASTAKYLFAEGANIIAVSDIHGTVFCDKGLDIPLLLRAKDTKGNIDRSKLPSTYKLEDGFYWLKNEVDVLIPAAIADAIHTGNVSEVKAKIIVEGANIPITKDAEQLLYEKGILVVPDFIANSAGAGLFGAILYKGVAPDTNSIFSFLSEKVSRSTSLILNKSKEDNITPRDAALLINKSKELVPHS